MTTTAAQLQVTLELEQNSNDGISIYVNNPAWVGAAPRDWRSILPYCVSTGFRVNERQAAIVIDYNSGSSAFNGIALPNQTVKRANLHLLYGKPEVLDWQRKCLPPRIPGTDVGKVSLDRAIGEAIADGFGNHPVDGMTSIVLYLYKHTRERSQSIRTVRSTPQGGIRYGGYLAS